MWRKELWHTLKKMANPNQRASNQSTFQHYTPSRVLSIHQFVTVPLVVILATKLFGNRSLFLIAELYSVQCLYLL